MANRKHAVRISLTAFLFLMLVGFAPAAFAQDTPNTPSQEPSGLDLAVSGQLKSVDPDMKKLVITTEEGTDVEFSYDENTEYSGETIEGLATSSGSQVRVFFREENGVKIATKIEVQASNETEGTGEAQPAPEPEPSPEPQPSPGQEQPDQPDLPQDPQEQPPLPNEPGTEPQEPGQVPPGA